MCHLRHNFFHLRNSRQETLKESLEPNLFKMPFWIISGNVFFKIFLIYLNVYLIFCGVIICKGGVVLHYAVTSGFLFFNKMVQKTFLKRVVRKFCINKHKNKTDSCSWK